MPQLVALAVIGAGLYAGARWASRKLAELRAAAERAEAELQRRAGGDEPRDLGRLELDPASGEYRPKRA